NGGLKHRHGRTRLFGTPAAAASIVVFVLAFPRRTFALRALHRPCGLLGACLVAELAASTFALITLSSRHTRHNRILLRGFAFAGIFHAFGAGDEAVSESLIQGVEHIHLLWFEHFLGDFIGSLESQTEARLLCRSLLNEKREFL